MFVGPIFVREAMTAPRRMRHYLARSAYGGLLFVLMWTAWQTMVGFQQVESVGDLARFGSVLFRIFAILQLSLALFFAPIVAGSSISAEKDRRTFELLLMTDLTNTEIVLGKMLSSLLQMAVLLAASLPIFALCLLLGGASPEQVLWVFAVTLAAALASGSLGILIASWRDKTFQTLALTVLIIVLYLAGVHAISGDWRLFGVAADSWRAMLSPFSATLAVLEPSATASSQGAPALANLAALIGMPVHLVPQLSFVVMMIVTAVAITAASIATLRVWNPGGGKATHSREAIEAMEKRQFEEAKHRPTQEPRPIWDNPILWREIRTRGYGRRPIVIKLAYFLVFALICFGFYLTIRDNPRVDQFAIAKALVPTVVLSLILINVQAVTSITSERDGRALDLLLVTDISPREFIFGKIWGVLYNTKEMIVLPLGLCVFLLAGGFVQAENSVYVVGSILVMVTFATSLGLHASLAYEKTRSAVINSLGTIVFLFIGILVCVFLILVSGRFESQAASFVVFIFAGAVALYASLAARNRSPAFVIVAASLPFMSWWAIVQFLQRSDPLGTFLLMAGSYGFAVLAMLVPAVSEFDVALGRTVADD